MGDWEMLDGWMNEFIVGWKYGQMMSEWMDE